MAQKLLLYIRYDGSCFCGYQAQKNGYSVQQALNEGTAALFGHPCDITGCSRTDSVHSAKADILEEKVVRRFWMV